MTSGSGRVGRAAAGVVRIGNTVGAAFTGRRVLEPIEARLMLGTGAALLLLAGLFLLFPRLLLYPLLFVFAWFGVVLLYRGYRLHRGRAPREAGPPRE
jgi:cardiolipin synthase